ncbi:hypothetical protein CDL15_Pgr021947 [Punica granatum]|nr:hypothetical protein CDL15_Pgr021947 [Punica granatum]
MGPPSPGGGMAQRGSSQIWLVEAKSSLIGVGSGFSDSRACKKVYRFHRRWMFSGGEDRGGGESGGGRGGRRNDSKF